MAYRSTARGLSQSGTSNFLSLAVLFFPFPFPFLLPSNPPTHIHYTLLSSHHTHTFRQLFIFSSPSSSSHFLFTLTSSFIHSDTPILLKHSHHTHLPIIRNPPPLTLHHTYPFPPFSLFTNHTSHTPTTPSQPLLPMASFGGPITRDNTGTVRRRGMSPLFSRPALPIGNMNRTVGLVEIERSRTHVIQQKSTTNGFSFLSLPLAITHLS